MGVYMSIYLVGGVYILGRVSIPCIYQVFRHIDKWGVYLIYQVFRQGGVYLITKYIDIILYSVRMRACARARGNN